MRSRQARPRKRRWPKIIGGLLGLLVVLIICGVVFFPQLNNTMRSTTGEDTPADKIVKNELVKKIDSSKTGDSQTDAALNKAASTLQKTKMSTIMKAAKNENDASALLAKTTDLSTSEAQAATSVVFSNAAYTKLRTAIANGNWVAAYKQYQTLSSNGNLSQLESEIN